MMGVAIVFLLSIFVLPPFWSAILSRAVNQAEGIFQTMHYIGGETLFYLLDISALVSANFKHRHNLL